MSDCIVGQSCESSALSSNASQSYSDGYRVLYKRVFPKLIKEIIDDGLKDPEISDAIELLQEVLNYSVPGGNCKALFKTIFPELLEELVTEDEMEDMEISDEVQDLKEVLHSTAPGDVNEDKTEDSKVAAGLRHLKEVLSRVPGGKCNRGLMVIDSLKHLIPGRGLTYEEETKAFMLGWCVEWLQAFFLVVDDFMDQSKLRGKPCWYLKEGIGLLVINDSFIYKILRKHFRSESYYVDILDLFHEITYQTELGHTLDLLTSSDDRADLSTFSVERYGAIVKYKTAFYSFYLPVALAMYMVGIKDQKSHDSAKAILLELGEFFQIQDDFLDCYGDPAETGKVGTDIEENKCSWLVVQALLRVTPEQRQLLQENYGCKESPESVECVKTLYKELGLEQLFREYKDTSYRKLVMLVERETTEARLPKELFLEFIDHIYKHNA